MSAIEESQSTVKDEATQTATRLIAEVRTRCADLGLTPRDYAELLLPEALLAMMVGGMCQEDVQEVFGTFVRDEVPAWFLQVKRHVGYCDCAREAHGEHLAHCAQLRVQKTYFSDGALQAYPGVR